MEMKTMGVIGAGTMGIGIAQTAAVMGYHVILRDIEVEFVNASVNRMDQYSTKSVAKGRMAAEQKEEALGRLVRTDRPQDLEEAGLVIEAILGNMELKESVFQELNQIYRKETIFASNTSSMSTVEIGKKSGRPDRLYGVHFFNPVPVMKLVEVIRRLNTSDETMETALYLALSLGKTPVEVEEDFPGFIVNRLLPPYLNEVAKALPEGVVTVEDIDTMVRLGLNYPMGPFQMIDFGGMQLIADVLNYFKEEFNDNSYVPQPLLRQVVRAGELGPKAGEGFYKYEQGRTVMQKKFEDVILNLDEGIATIMLNRPQVMNALCDALNTDLLEAVRSVYADGMVRALIITGSGKAFAAGADIEEMINASQFDAERTAREAHSINDILEILPISVIAVVNGPTLGGDCEIALSCGFRVAGESSVLGLPEVGLGIIPGAGGTQRLTKIVGPVKTKEITMAGKVVKGKKAYETGLATKYVPDEKVLKEAFALAEKISQKPAAALQYAKSAINYAVDSNVHTGSQYEKPLFSLCFETKDQKGGMKAFAEKRKPDLTNRR